MAEEGDPPVIIEGNGIKVTDSDGREWLDVSGGYYSIHVGYGPYWMMSQNIATMDVPSVIKPETWKRYNTEQKELFQPWLRQGSKYQLA